MEQFFSFGQETTQNMFVSFMEQTMAPLIYANWLTFQQEILVILQFLLASEADSEIIRTDVPDVPMLCAPDPLRGNPEPIEPPPQSPPFPILPFDNLGPRSILDRDSGSSGGKPSMSTGVQVTAEGPVDPVTSRRQNLQKEDFPAQFQLSQNMTK